MNEPAPAIWTTKTTEVVKTGSWRVALPMYVNPPAPCHKACPVDGDIAVWIRHIQSQAYQDAWLTLIPATGACSTSLLLSAASSAL
jgi:hypothetical protein